MDENVDPRLQTMREPLGSVSEAAKKAATSKIFLRKIDGSWMPEFIGDSITAVDLERSLRTLKTGYRRYKRLLNLKARQNEREAREVESAKV